jgi:hypothetical protein
VPEAIERAGASRRERRRRWRCNNGPVSTPTPRRAQHTVLQEFFGLSQPLGERAARPLDVRARPWMAAIQEEHAGPDVDRLIVLSRKVMIEADEQELLDLRVAIRLRHGILRV